MKLSELKNIIDLLPNDIEVTLNTKNNQALKRVFWGNHDGRYNMECPACGWTSPDILPGHEEPVFCPKCGGK